MAIAAVNQSTPSLDKTRILINDIDGLNSIFEVVSAIFAVLEHCFESLKTTFKPLSDCIFAFTNLSCFVSIIKRIKEWSCPDGKGKMLWDKSWQGLVSTATLSVSNALTFFSVLDSFKLLQLGSALSPLNLLNNIFYTIAYIFDIWTYGLSIQKNNSTLIKAKNLKEVWERIANSKNLPEAWQAHTRAKVAKWTQILLKSACNPSTQHLATQKKLSWEKQHQCTDEAHIKAICAERIQTWNAKITKCETENRKSWVAIALDIITIAMTIVGFILPFLPGGLILAVLLITLGSSVMDLISYILDLGPEYTHYAVTK